MSNKCKSAPVDLVKKRSSSFAQGQQTPRKTGAQGKQGTLKRRQTRTARPEIPQDVVQKPLNVGYDHHAEKKFKQMLLGDLSDLPHLPHSIVRIFLSSTFSDMRAERNMLARQVYPELRRRCTEMELDFQVVDLRWGLTSETENDHSGTKICLQEVRNCQQLSLGPNFVSILGYRYGMHRPLVVEYPVSEFEILMEEAKALGLEDIPLVEMWYKKDDNAQPPVYGLQTIRTYFPNFGDNTPGKEKLREKDLEGWTDTFHRLQTTMQTAAASAFKAKKISEMAWRQHFMSVTDHEVMKGIVEADQPELHTVFFRRELTGLIGDAHRDADARSYIDVKEWEGQVYIDFETKKMIDALVKKVNDKLKASQAITLSPPWHRGGINPEKFPEHQQYLSEFCSLFLNKVNDLISMAKASHAGQIRQNEWYSNYNELVHHLKFCRVKCESFCGQDQVLQKAKAYILNSCARQPFVIHAASGAGKTSIMAMIMNSLKVWLPAGHVGIIRFLGTSPLSIHIDDVLFGVLGHLADVADIAMERINYRTWKRLKAYAPRFLRRVASKTACKVTTVVLLDSLDQLAPDHDAYSMDWLPAVLPQNIKIIVSTLPNRHGILDSLKKHVPDQSCYCAVPHMAKSTGQQIIHKYLKLRNRTVTEEQLALMMKAFSANASPLYLKLLMDQAVKWPSHFTPDPSSIPESIQVAINLLFDALEVKFGPRLVQSALGLLTVGFGGLTDIEMEDALSCSDAALDEVYKFHDPPVPGIVRIPPVIWARIHYELKEYLVERFSQGKTTKCWYHRQFIEAASERYTQGNDGARLHAALFEMFSAENGVKRDITLTNRVNLFVKDADRQTTPQPLSVANIRKLHSMHHHLLHTKDLVSSDEAKAAVYTNFAYLSTKIAALGVDKVLEDLKEYLEVSKDEEVASLIHFIDSRKNAVCNQRIFAFSLTACLSPTASHTSLRNLQKQAEQYLATSNLPQLIPCLPCLASRPGDPSFMLSGFTHVVHQVGDCILLEKESVDEEVKSFAIVNVASSDVHDLLLDAEVISVCLLNEGQGYAFLSENTLKLKKSATAKEVTKPVSDLFGGSRALPKASDTLRITVSGDWLGVCASDAAVVSVSNTSLSKQTVIPAPQLENSDIQSLQLCVSDSDLFVVSGNFGARDKTQSYVAMWKSGSSSPQSVIKMEGQLSHSLVTTTADDEFIIGPVCTVAGKYGLAVISLQPFKLKTPELCEEITQLRTSSSEQIVAVLERRNTIRFITLSSNGPLQDKAETVSHAVAVTDFDVMWNDGQVIVADLEGKLCVYSLAGVLLTSWLGHFQGICYLKVVGDCVTILTCSRLLKVWDQAALSDLISGSLAEKEEEEGKSESLGLQTTIANILISHQDSQLLTITTTGEVAAWALDSLKQLRSFSIGIFPDVFLKAGFSLGLVLDKEKKTLKQFSLDSGVAMYQELIPENAIGVTVGSGGQSIIILSEQPQLTLHQVDLMKKTVKKQSIQLGFSYVTIDPLLSASKRYLTLQVKIPEDDYKAIEMTWKKNNLFAQPHPNRYVALDLSGPSSHVLPCLRHLTKTPHLGVKIVPYHGNSMLIATRRRLIFWDIPTGKCDQRLSPNRKTMFFRPDWVKTSAGANVAVHCSPKSNFLAAGSEDGYVFVYHFESGMPVGMKAPATKHEAPVTHLYFTPDNKYVLSVCQNGVLKMWSSNSGAQVAAAHLGTKLRNMLITGDGQYMVALTDTERSHVVILKLHPGKS